MQVPSNSTQFDAGSSKPNAGANPAKVWRSTTHSWPVAWDVVGVPATEEEANELVDECRNRLSIMVSYVDALVKARRGGRARKLQRQLLNSQSAMVAALKKACVHKDWPVPAVKIIEAAGRMSMWGFTGERPRLITVSKDEAGTRPAFDFGAFEYARQYLGHLAARPFAQLSPRQFLYQGGVPAMFRWLEEHLPNAKVVMTTDVPNCFLSLIRERVEADGLLPVPVLRSLLFVPMRKALLPFEKEKGKAYVSPTGYAVDYSSEHSSEASYEDLIFGRGAYEGRAIPPGSAISSLVAEVSLRSLLDAVEADAEGVLAASFADNIIILVPSKKAAKACLKALHAAALIEFGEHVARTLRARTEEHAPQRRSDF